ncbi:MAG TPA: hypothetical protein VIH76_18430 [Candidatus Acidoferrales bacterium]
MKFRRFLHRGATMWCLAASCLLAAGCGGGSNGSGSGGTGGGQPGGLNLSLSSSTIVAQQNGTPATISATITGNSSAATVAVNGLPNGTTAQITQPSGTTAGSISLASSVATPAGTYAASVTATSGSSSVSQNLSVVVAVSVAVANSVATKQGVNGTLQQFMSTSFQPAEWDYAFFTNYPSVTPLNNLGPQHIRLQGVSQAVPMIANSNPQQPTDWDFTILDAVVQPVLSAGDHSPEFQIAVAPAFMNNSSGQFDMANLNEFVAYSANLVRYYNTGGFTWGGQLFKSPSANKITWWGIFNEYNINGLTPADYVQVYNAVVPAMLAVDPTIKFSALELSDFDSGDGDPRNNLPAFVAAPGAGGVNAQVNIVSTHFYSSCDQTDTDTQLFSKIPSFVSDVGYFYQELQTRADLAAVPVWVTENNVNADYDAGNGMSACNPGQTFVIDDRGTSAFFAAWRPYVFSQLGKAGNQALYHWNYDADQQFGEVDYDSGGIYLSYWVDQALGQMFPSAAPPSILALSATDTSTVEVLATKNSDGSVVVMVADRAVHAASDDNGTGDPRTVVVDISALGKFSSATTLAIDANTNIATGPSSVAISLAPQITVTLGGYGVIFLALEP